MLRQIYKTDIEQLMENELKKENIEFVFQYPIRGKYGYIADFFLPKYNLIIECDGECWHKEGNSHDRKRNAVLCKKYKILRFKGEQIKNNITLCLTIIREVTQNGESCNKG